MWEPIFFVLSLWGDGGGLYCPAEEDGICAVNCSHRWVRKPRGISLHIFHDFFFLKAFLKLDQGSSGLMSFFLRPCFAIVILADGLSAFDS